MKRLCLGILTTHPIQYQAPWFRYLAKRMDLEVFYAHRQDAKGQARAGFGVEFEWDLPLLEGYPYHWLKNVAAHPGVGSFNGCDTPEIDEVVRKGEFDAFLIFGWNYKSAVQTILACRRNKVPVLLRGDSHLATNRPWIKRALKELPYRWLLPKAAGHLYVGKRNKEYLQYYGVPEEKLFFAPHFVDNGFFREHASWAEKEGKTAEIRSQFGIPKEAFVFLFVGKMIPKKRSADFIQACLNILAMKVSSESIDVHALLVGDGSLRESLESLARPYAERIHFAGFKNQSELPAFYRAADTLVLPSDSRETWGLVVNEAFASGIPAIVSDAVGCAPDLIEEGQTGSTYPVGDVNALLQRMLELKTLCQRKSETVRPALAEKISLYSIEKATEGLEVALARMCTNLHIGIN